jgi:fructose-1-phosphate kinase PfkB-like protein
MREVNQRGATWVLVTDGPNSLYLTSASECFRFTPLPTAVVNPIGCGDCLAAGIACALQRSMSVVDAVRFGMAAAADNARQLLPSRLDPVRINEQYQSVNCEVLRG